MDIYGFLAKNGIGYERHDHPAVFTCEEAERFVPPLPAAKTKNLLFRDKKGRRHFLVVVGYEKEVDTGSLASVLGVGKLSLASPERLRRYLGVDPGSVTILAVVNDPEGRVEIVMDEALWGSSAFRCHPLVNTSTLVVSRGDLVRFFDITGHRVRVIDIPGKSSLPPLGREGTLG